MIALTALVFGGLVSGCRHAGDEPLATGPSLLPADEAIGLAMKQGVLADVTETYLQTCGPIYRVLRGHDKSGRVWFVWIGRQVVHSVPADEGVPREEILAKAGSFLEAGYSVRADLVYISPEAKDIALEAIRESPGNVFWWVRVFDEASSKSQSLLSLWYSFESGEPLGG